MRQNNEMDEFRWIKISLFLILVLQFRAVTGQDSYITVRDGDEVTLSCKNVINDQDKCDGTTWMYGRKENSTVVELIKLGQIGRYSRDRLSVTVDCSLVIKKVTLDDFGRYSCRQFDRSGQQQGQDAKVYLSVININEQRDDDKVTLTCSVLKYEYCQDTVEWLYDGNSDDFTNLGKSSCGAAVTFTASNLDQTSHYSELFKCKVTERNGGTLLFNFTPQSSCEKHIRTDCSALSYIMLVMRVAELLLITVITVLLFRARGNQRPPDDNIDLKSVRSRTAKRSGPAASQEQNDEDDGAVKYENFGEPSTSVRLH
ncbi:uncharacterized protein [Thunnus thynnus]|uniref:uncharacterized protein n=1 Tax=Thunnus thynnus TaxID=8237 RepID=UPI00352994CA